MKLRYVAGLLVTCPLIASFLVPGESSMSMFPTPGRSILNTGTSCVKAESVSQLGLSAEQTDVARRGIAAAQRAGVGRVGSEIIVATGLVESELTNLSHGDRDSLGWLQQRPSQGWGNSQNVDAAADDFFAALKQVPDWQNLEPGAAAQKVQRSAFPDRYAQRMGEARNIVATLTGADCPVQAVAAARSGVAGVVLAWADSHVGDEYVMGANGPGAWDCSSFARTAFAQVGLDMPRTADAQRDWCAQGNCERVREGAEQPGDLIFWDSYLGPSTVGHVAVVKEPSTRTTVDARSRSQGVIHGTYPQAKNKNILEFWRPKMSSR